MKPPTTPAPAQTLAPSHPTSHSENPQSSAPAQCGAWAGYWVPWGPSHAPGSRAVLTLSPASN